MILAGGMAATVKALAPVTRSPIGARPAAVSWPSVHAAVLGALAVCVTLLANKQARRPTAAASVVGLLLCCFSLVVAQAHTPMDVLAGCFLTGFVSALVVA
jgi:membrane-associated phospholipid phosphatase